MPEITSLPTQSEALDQLVAALAEAQGEFQPIQLNRTVVVQKKAGGSYTFEYATLDAVLDATVPALSRHGLAISSTFSLDGIFSVYLMHKSGQWRACHARVANPLNDLQGFGSNVTYLRRYFTMSMLNVAGEYEDDGNRAVGNEAVPQIDPFDPLWDALAAKGIVEKNAIRAWCEGVLGRSIPTTATITELELARLLSEARAKPQEADTAIPMATEAQCKELNAALDELKPWGASTDGMDAKAAATKRKEAKLQWATGMLKLSTPVKSLRDLKEDEVARLIAAAKAGEVPQDEQVPF